MPVTVMVRLGGKEVKSKEEGYQWQRLKEQYQYNEELVC
jgi:hypothetical protein